RASPRDAVATIAPASLTRTAFTADVPTSIPKYTHLPPSRLRWRRTASSPFPSRISRSSRQIVPHHDVDPDLLLFAQDWLAAGKCEQYAHGRPRLMTRILRDGRIHHILQKQLAGHDGYVVADEYDLICPP